MVFHPLRADAVIADRQVLADLTLRTGSTPTRDLHLNVRPRDLRDGLAGHGVQGAAGIGAVAALQGERARPLESQADRINLASKDQQGRRLTTAEGVVAGEGVHKRHVHRNRGPQNLSGHGRSGGIGV